MFYGFIGKLPYYDGPILCPSVLSYLPVYSFFSLGLLSSFEKEGDKIKDNSVSNLLIPITNNSNSIIPIFCTHRDVTLKVFKHYSHPKEAPRLKPGNQSVMGGCA